MKKIKKQKMEDWLDDWSGRSIHSKEKLHLSGVMCSTVLNLNFKTYGYDKN